MSNRSYIDDNGKDPSVSAVEQSEEAGITPGFLGGSDWPAGAAYKLNGEYYDGNDKKIKPNKKRTGLASELSSAERSAENDILEYLEAYVERFVPRDVVSLSGTSKGLLKNNKTGDILAYVGGENSGKKVAIECKFDKSIKLGDVDSPDIASNKYDTAWSQLLEATVNRGANASIIVFDKTLADASIQRVVNGVTYIDNIGFICIIDYEASDYHNLAIAYNLARGLALRSEGKNVEVGFVNMLIQRLLKDIRDVQNIEMLVKTNIKNNQQILKNIEKSLLSIEFNQQYLVKYMEDGVLSKADLLDFYQREDIRAKYKLISKEIESLEADNNIQNNDN